MRTGADCLQNSEYIFQQGNNAMPGMEMLPEKYTRSRKIDSSVSKGLNSFHIITKKERRPQIELSAVGIDRDNKLITDVGIPEPGHL